MTHNIVIFGNGFVGSALDFFLMTHSQAVKIVDPNKENTPLPDSLLDSDMSFICVPTPPDKDGRCDITLVQSVLADIITRVDKTIDYPVVIRSTMIGAQLSQLQESYPELNIIFWPEFLREKSARDDTLKPQLVILGGTDYERVISSKPGQLLNDIFNEGRINKPTSKFHIYDYDTASLIKYSINSFLAMKVTFFNNLFDIHSASDSTVDFRTLAMAIGADKRIGWSHTKVPGHDGARGWGGSCFPKDTTAFAKYSDDIGAPFEILETAIKSNTIHRLK